MGVTGKPFVVLALVVLFFAGAPASRAEAPAQSLHPGEAAAAIQECLSPVVSGDPNLDLDGEFYLGLMEALTLPDKRNVSREDAERIGQELASLYRCWTSTADAFPPPSEFAATCQLLTRYYVTKPVLSGREKALLESQRTELFKFVDALPGRFVREFGWPDSATSDTAAEFAKGRADLWSLATSDFHRFAQEPQPEEEFREFMKKADTHAREVAKWGKTDFDEIALRSLSYPAPKRRRDEERRKEEKRSSARLTIRAMAVYLHGGIAGALCTRYYDAARPKRKDWIFPFGEQGGYGLEYRFAGKGILFHFRPVEKSKSAK